MAVALTALAFASIFISQLDQMQVPPLVIAFYRMAFTSLMLWPAAVSLKWREIISLSRRDLGLLTLGGLFLAVHFGSWIASLSYIPIATSVVLVNSHPVFVVLGSWLFLREKPSVPGIAGAILGVIGIVVIGWSGIAEAEFALVGDALAVLGAVTVVGYFIIGRHIRARLSLLAYVTPLYSICTVFLLIWCLAAGDQLYPYRTSAWLLFAALAAVPTILGHTGFNWAIKHVRPTAVSLVFLGEPLLASVLAFLFFGQVPPLTTLLGGSLILMGGLPGGGQEIGARD